MSRSGPLTFINNSRETFTPTKSGAIATCLLEVGRAATAEGVAPVIVSRRHPREDATTDWPALRLLPPIPDEPARAAATVRRVRRRLNGWARPDQWEYAHQLLPVLRELDPSCVVLSNDPEIAVQLRRRLPEVRVVHWFHNLELCSDRFRRFYAADQGIVSVAVSSYLARAIENVYRLAPLSVHTSLNGVDADRFAAAERPQRTPVIGYLGRLGIEKGADVLLAAARILRERGLEFAVQLVGETNWGETNENPFSRRVAGLAEALSDTGVEVLRPGHVPRAGVPGALLSSDIHVVPSRWDEPCALTLFEGLASGQPVVGSAT
ncbi:MAG: glycosyltransferase family 4 protein, partial [Propionicimonas sp.]